MPAREAERPTSAAVTVAKGGNWCGELRPGFAVRKENPIRAEVIVELSPPMARL